jgi:hypothetical protein
MNAVGRVHEALQNRPSDKKVGIDPDFVEFFEAHAF